MAMIMIQGKNNLEVKMTEELKNHLKIDKYLRRRYAILG